MPPGTAAIVVNNNSAFFNNGYTVDSGKYTGGTAQAQVEIPLHELGHALDANGFQPDLNNRPAGRANDSLIDENCSATISRFK